MRIDPIFERVFKAIYGQPAWNVSPGWGSFLTFEFGGPHLEIREPIVAGNDVAGKARQELAKRRVYIHGEWHLWINCCDWEVRSNGQLIGQSTSTPTFEKAADLLNGQKLTHFSLIPEPHRCIFEFDLGGKLETHPYDSDSEQWLVYDSREHTVLVLRADGVYSYGPSNRPATNDWKPILAS